MQQQLPRLGHGQNAQLGLSRFSQASFGRFQIVIVVAWMTNELPGAIGNDFCNHAEESLVERTGDHDAQRAIGSDHSLPLRRISEFVGKSAEKSYLCVARPESGAFQ